jgi:hypothetical protein
LPIEELARKRAATMTSDYWPMGLPIGLLIVLVSVSTKLFLAAKIFDHALHVPGPQGRLFTLNHLWHFSSHALVNQIAAGIATHRGYCRPMTYARYMWRNRGEPGGSHAAGFLKKLGPKQRAHNTYSIASISRKTRGKFSMRNPDMLDKILSHER